MSASQFTMHIVAKDATRKISVHWKFNSGTASVFHLIEGTYMGEIAILSGLRFFGPSPTVLEFQQYLDDFDWDSFFEGVNLYRSPKPVTPRY